MLFPALLLSSQSTTKLWWKACAGYLEVLRIAGGIAEAIEEAHANRFIPS